jgi:TPP-dependent pyruvate/acetoin dehydrogenase alpha subunit
MTEKKPENKQEITNDILMADVMLRVTAIEKLLIEKGIFTQEELSKSTEEIAKRVAKVVLEKAQASKSVQEFVADLEATARSKKGDPTN